MLARLRQNYPVALHGVALSVGSVDGVRLEYLKKVKALADRIDPFQISDHFCFSRFGTKQYHELLPLPLTKAMAMQTIRNIDRVQSFLKRALVFENISAYAEFPRNEMTEPEFLNFIARESGCKILLDINNIYVNAANFRFNARRYLAAIDPAHVAQYHLAGFTDLKTHLFDTHAEKIHRPVLQLYREALHHIGERPVSLERDDRIPGFKALEHEIRRAGGLQATAMPEKFSENSKPLYPVAARNRQTLKAEKTWQQTIYSRVPSRHERSAGDLTPRGVQQVYRNAYQIRLTGALRDKFIWLTKAMAERQFSRVCKTFLAAVPSTAEDLGRYGTEMPQFLRRRIAAKPWFADLAHFDLLRYRLFAAPLAGRLADPFARKVSLSPAAALWQSRYRIFESQNRLSGKIRLRPQYALLYRDGFSVKMLLCDAAMFDFLKRLSRPVSLRRLLASVEAENQLPAAAVKRLFRILGLPGILI